MKRRLGLVVPALDDVGGGVCSVARFVKNAALRSGAYDLTLISLATAARDPASLSVTRPSTWLRGPAVVDGTWDGLPFRHVGAIAGEAEVRRYLPRKILAAEIAGCDLLQVVCGSPAYAHTVVGLGKPVSIQCATRAKVERRRRDAGPHGPGGWLRRRMTALTDRIDDTVLRTADAIQVENAWMYEYATRINGDRDVDIRLAPPGIDAGAFHPAAARDLDRDPYVLCVGRLDDPRKNVELLLSAFAGLPAATRRRLRLVLAGQARPARSFWQRAESLGVTGSVQFIQRPSQAELIALYQQASMFVLPSDEEGLGIVLLEAMGCGVPVISTRSGGPDGMITDGADGFLIPLDDATALTERIELLQSDRARNERMGRQARATIEARYTQQVAEQLFLDVWDRLAHRRQP